MPGAEANGPVGAGIVYTADMCDVPNGDYYDQYWELREQINAVARDEFADLPAVIWHWLVHGGYFCRGQVVRATDAELLACRNIGKGALQTIRATIGRA